MARGVDLSALSRGERLVLAASFLLFANAFVPWWFRVPTPGRTYWHNAGLTGWSVATTFLALATVCAVLIRAGRFPERGPADGIAYAIAGGLELGALALDTLLSRGEWLGLYAAMALAGAVIWAGFVRRAERRAGWI